MLFVSSRSGMKRSESERRELASIGSGIAPCAMDISLPLMRPPSGAPFSTIQSASFRIRVSVVDQNDGVCRRATRIVHHDRSGPRYFERVQADGTARHAHLSRGRRSCGLRTASRPAASAGRSTGRERSTPSGPASDSPVRGSHPALGRALECFGKLLSAIGRISSGRPKAHSLPTQRADVSDMVQPHPEEIPRCLGARAALDRRVP